MCVHGRSHAREHSSASTKTRRRHRRLRCLGVGYPACDLMVSVDGVRRGGETVFRYVRSAPTTRPGHRARIGWALSTALIALPSRWRPIRREPLTRASAIAEVVAESARQHPMCEARRPRRRASEGLRRPRAGGRAPRRGEGPRQPQDARGRGRRRRLVRHRAGRGRRLPRPERRGQDDDAQDALGPPLPDGRRGARPRPRAVEAREGLPARGSRW